MRPSFHKKGHVGILHRFALRLQQMGLFILMILGFNFFVIIQFHWRGWGMHLPSKENLGNEFVGLGPPLLHHSEQGNNIEQGNSEQTQIGSSPQKQNEANLRKGKGKYVSRKKWLRILDEKGTKTLPKPNKWEMCGYHQLRHHFNCDGLDAYPKPLPTLQDWDIYKNTYKTMVDEHATFDDPVPSTEGYTLNEDGPPPFYASLGTRGRGLFASRDIKKGELVHDGSNIDLRFPNALAWRRYVFSLPRRMACDAIDWTWTQHQEILTDMNIAILMNAANWKSEGETEPNLSASTKMYATRDIKKGEELLYNYEEHDKNWGSVGL